jgi:hypothetical protein
MLARNEPRAERRSRDESNAEYNAGRHRISIPTMLRPAMARGQAARSRRASATTMTSSLSSGTCLLPRTDPEPKSRPRAAFLSCCDARLPSSESRRLNPEICAAPQRVTRRRARSQRPK